MAIIGLTANSGSGGERGMGEEGVSTCPCNGERGISWHDKYKHIRCPHLFRLRAERWQQRKAARDYDPDRWENGQLAGTLIYVPEYEEL